MKKIIKWSFVLLAATGCVFAVRFGVASLVDVPPISETANIAEFSGKNELLSAEKTAIDLPEDFKAEAAGVFDLSCGCKILSFKGQNRWPLASLTKLMTAVVAFENIDADETIVIGEKAIASAGSNGGLYIGERFSVSDLIKAMMVTSSNSAASALANSLPEGGFVRLMNAKAAEIGLTETSFFEPIGLSVLNQSTVDDVLKLAGYIREKQPIVFETSRRTRETITEKKTNKTRTLININSFAGRPDFLGGKTGYTEEAEGNLLSIFRTTKGIAFFVVFGAANRFDETEKLLKQINGFGSD
jgi:D-alanyl-D-alanine carboxypeptidase (penicillin-binding protein 5/6)